MLCHSSKDYSFICSLNVHTASSQHRALPLLLEMRQRTRQVQLLHKSAYNQKSKKLANQWLPSIALQVQHPNPKFCALKPEFWVQACFSKSFRIPQHFIFWIFGLVIVLICFLLLLFALYISTSIYIYILLRETRARTQGRKWSRDCRESCLLAYSPYLPQTALLYHLGPLFQG